MTPVESFTLDEGTDAYGVNTRLIFQGDEVIKHQSYDMSAHIERATAIRNATEGERWGEMRHVLHLGPLEYAEISAIKDQSERLKRIRKMAREKPNLVTFSKYLKK